MTTQRFWIISILLFAAHLVIVFAVINMLGSVDKYGLAIAICVLFAFIIALFILVSGLAALLSFIPFKQRLYIGKFRVLFLSIIAFLLFCFSVVLVLSFYFGNEIRSEESFANIEIPAGLNCSSIRDGKFETDKLLIERNGNVQIEINKRWGSEKEFKVEWTSDCEYILTPVSDSETRVRVKIVEVNGEGYSCYAMVEEHLDWSAPLYRFKRVE